MESAYKKQTCKQIYENKEIEREQRVEMMKTLKCHKMEFKNFDATLDPFLQADTSHVFYKSYVVRKKNMFENTFKSGNETACRKVLRR